MLSGSLAWSLSKRKMADGESAWISETSTEQRQKMSIMDGNANYNQIFMAPEDVHKTAFIVPGAVGLFEYLVMTFGLKNAGATYQRAMNYIFHDLIGKLVEICIDDVVVKSTSAGGIWKIYVRFWSGLESLGLK